MENYNVYQQGIQSRHEDTGIQATVMEWGMSHCINAFIARQAEV